MSTEVVEEIDSSQMEALSEFAAEGEIVDNRDRFRIGILGDDVIIAGHGLSGGWRGSMLFEQRNLHDVTQRLRDVLDGKLREHTEDRFIIEQGKDYLVIGAQAPRYEVRVSIINGRLVNMDKLEANHWSLRFSPDTAYRLHDELAKLIQQGIS